VVPRQSQDGGGDHPSRGGSGNEPGGRIDAGDAAKSPGRRYGGGLTVELLIVKTAN